MQCSSKRGCFLLSSLILFAGFALFRNFSSLTPIACPDGGMQIRSQADQGQQSVPEKTVAQVAPASGLTAIVNDASESRKFSIDQCEQTVVLQDLYPVFVAHQVEWSSMGQTMPWWSVLSGLPKNSEIPENLKVEFYASGRRHVDEFIIQSLNAPDLQTFHNIMADPVSTAEKAPIPGHTLASNYHSGRLRLFPPKKGGVGLMPLGKVLDFGCGLGRLAFNFARFATSVTCVDQSPFHLRQAALEWQVRKQEYGRVGNIEFLLSSPDLLAAVNGRRFDFVHTVIVLQHMVPQLQAVYLEQFCDVLAPGGYGWLQIPIAKQKVDEACDMDRSIKTGGLQMHGTTAKHIVNHMSMRGCNVEVLSAGDCFIGHVGGISESGFVLFNRPT